MLTRLLKAFYLAINFPAAGWALTTIRTAGTPNQLFK